MAIVTKKENLPDTIKDLAKFVIVNFAKSQAARNALLAAEKSNMPAEQMEKIREAVRDCSELQLDAEVKLGEYFKGLEKAKPGPKELSNTVVTKLQQAADLGFDKMTVSRMEALADNRDIVEQVKAEARENDDVPTRTAVLKIVKENKIKEQHEELKKQAPQKIIDKKFQVIVIDPPWPIEFMKLDNRPNQVMMPYPTMTIDEIKVMKMPADEDCGLFLWTTHTFLHESFHILESWGFKYHCCLTWDKTNGRSLCGFNRRTELCLYAYKGKINTNQRGSFIDTVFVEKLREHSRKPDIFYKMIKEHTPEPRVDIFSREKRDGFEQWGNDIAKF